MASTLYTVARRRDLPGLCKFHSQHGENQNGFGQWQLLNAAAQQLPTLIECSLGMIACKNKASFARVPPALALAWPNISNAAQKRLNDLEI